MTPLFPAGAEGVQISQQRMKKETRSTFKRSSEPFLFGHKTLSCSFQNSQSQTFLFLLCQNERGRGAQLQIQASIQQGF